MKTSHRLLLPAILLALVFGLGFSGCSSPPTGGPTQSSGEDSHSHKDGDGHDHDKKDSHSDDDGHGHDKKGSHSDSDGHDHSAEKTPSGAKTP